MIHSVDISINVIFSMDTSSLRYISFSSTLIELYAWSWKQFKIFLLRSNRRKLCMCVSALFYVCMCVWSCVRQTQTNIQKKMQFSAAIAIHLCRRIIIIIIIEHVKCKDIFYICLCVLVAVYVGINQWFSLPPERRIGWIEKAKGERTRNRPTTKISKVSN